MTPKVERFIQEYVKDLNATAAAIRAGYRKSHAASTSCNLLKDPAVAAQIAARKGEINAEARLDASELLKLLIEAVEADALDLYGEDGEFLPMEGWPLIWRRGLIVEIHTKEEFKTDKETGERTSHGRVIKVKTACRVRLLDLLGKHVQVGAFQTNIKVEGLDTIGERLDRAARRAELQAALDAIAAADADKATLTAQAITPASEPYPESTSAECEPLPGLTDQQRQALSLRMDAARARSDQLTAQPSAVSLRAYQTPRHDWER